MKKIFMLLTVLMLSLSAAAQSYRGMFDFNVGLVTSDKRTMTGAGETFDVKPFMGFQVTTSHGCQITPYLFAGLGFGANMAFSELGFSNGSHKRGKSIDIGTVPIFFDARWDLDVRRKITPFVDIKIGYQINVMTEGPYLDLYDNRYGYENTYNDYAELRSGSSIFFQPTAGVRFRMGKHTGFNLGIAYNAITKRQLLINEVVKDSSNAGMVLLNMGFDF